MTKDTHIAGGLAITMALAMPQGFKELAVCLTAATIGSVISDIDITTSESRRDLNKILIISVVAIVILSFPTSAFSYFESFSFLYSKIVYSLFSLKLITIPLS